MKNLFKIIFTIIAALIGAGFASGKEIYTFFYAFGIYGALGIIISSFIISLTIYKVLTICYTQDINTYKEFCIYVLTKLCKHSNATFVQVTSDYITKIVNYLLLISFYIMISGFSSFLNQEYNIKSIIGSVIIVSFCYLAFKKNISSLIKISNYIIPVFIMLLVFISLQSLHFVNDYNISLNIKHSGFIAPFAKSVLYAGYNCTLLIPVLITLKNFIKKQKNICFTSIISFIIIVLLSMCIFFILLLGNSKIYLLDMPLIEIVNNFGKMIKIFYLFMIGCSIYTTAISTGCSFLNGCDLKRYNKNSIYMCLSAIIISQISFSIFVELLYPVLGILGFIEIMVVFGTPLKNIINQNNYHF